MGFWLSPVGLNFNPPTPCGVGHGRAALNPLGNINFNPPTPCGVGPNLRRHRSREREFQSTHPVRGGTETFTGAVNGMIFQSTHPVRGGTANVFVHQRAVEIISIHPPRAGWDLPGYIQHTRRDNFNPPTPCGVGRSSWMVMQMGKIISIHPPRAGWDVIALTCALGTHIFQSTHPVRGGTSS